MKTSKSGNIAPINSGQAASAAATVSENAPINPASFWISNDFSLNNEKVIRSIACVLTILSETGNKDIEGSTAYGLSLALEQVADRIHRHDDLRGRDY